MVVFNLAVTTGDALTEFAVIAGHDPCSSTFSTHNACSHCSGNRTMLLLFSFCLQWALIHPSLVDSLHHPPPPFAFPSSLVMSCAPRLPDTSVRSPVEQSGLTRYPIPATPTWEKLLQTSCLVVRSIDILENGANGSMENESVEGVTGRFEMRSFFERASRFNKRDQR